MVRLDCSDRAARTRMLATAASAARRGDLVLVPTESSYALATDAFSTRGARALRLAKGQGSHVPLPVLVPSMTTVGGIAAAVSDDARALMTAFWPGSLTILLTPQPTLAWEVPSGAPLAVRMPLHPILLALLDATGPLVATAANGVGMSPPLTVDEAIAQLGEVAAVALDAGSLINAPASTIIDATSGPIVVRRHGGVSVSDLRDICPDLVDAAAR
jgi:L-threonylcarbamoyladenylate synthase